MTDVTPTTVIKVGGSLFDLPDLSKRLSNLLRRFADSRVVLVAGGGATANTVRDLQPVHQLTDAAAHRIAMESLRVGEQLLFELVPDAEFLSTVDQKHSVAIARSAELIELPVGRAATFVCGSDLNEQPLPGAELRTSPRRVTGGLRPRADWSFTSDSIAALIAHVVGARKLVLLKSVTAPTSDELYTSGKVDAAFQQYANGLDVCWCDLRQDEPTVLPIG